MPEPQPPLAGATLAHYRLANRLGAGGMGEVYAAEDTKLGRRIALKTLLPALAGDPLRLERFRREARAVAALNHPNIVTIHSVEEDRGIHFLTMELVEGETLRQRLRQGGLAPAELLELAVPLADAIGAAHERGIAHRDLKPENVMVTRDGRVKVLDFGLAQLRERAVAVDSQAVTYLTEAGAVMGTAAYLATPRSPPTSNASSAAAWRRTPSTAIRAPKISATTCGTSDASWTRPSSSAAAARRPRRSPRRRGAPAGCRPCWRCFWPWSWARAGGC